MPVYVYAHNCGRIREIVKSVKEHTKTIPCECGGEMWQKLTPVHVIADIEPYRSMATGERIKGRSHHRQHLKDHGLIEVGNERVTDLPTMDPVGPDVKEAIEMIKAGKGAKPEDNFLDDDVTDRVLSEAGYG
jgi:hypothetical protein